MAKTAGFLKSATLFCLAPLLGLLATVPGVSAATFYVATNGNDAAAGTLPSPWRTIQKAANTLAPGDTVLVRGGVYPERVTVNVSGSAAAGFVTFRNYPGETPILDGASLTVPSSDNGLFLIANRSFVVIQGFELRNYRTSARNIVPAGIFVTGAAHDLQIRSNRVHHIETGYQGKNGGDAFGIVVYGTSAAQPITNLAIQANEVFNLKTGSSESLTVNGNVSGFDVSWNRVHDNNNIGIDFIGYERVCSDAGQDTARNGACRSNLVWNISSYGNPAYGKEYSADGIYCDGSTSVVVEKNQVWACDIGVELACETPNRPTSQITFRDNLIWSNRVVGLFIGGYDAKRGRTESCSMTGNLFWRNDTLHQGNGEFGLQHHTVSNIFTHNTLAANSQNLLIGNQAESNTNNLVDWNVYWAPDGADNAQWEWKKVLHTGFAAWQTASGNDAHSVFASAGFASDLQTNFHLTTVSPP